jgi:hypothetical protein
MADALVTGDTMCAMKLLYAVTFTKPYMHVNNELNPIMLPANHPYLCHQITLALLRFINQT